MIEQEETLIRQVLEGQNESFRTLIDRYYAYLYRVVNGVLHHPKDAEDVTQEAFVKIYAALPQYQFLGLKTWMTRIAVNAAIDYKRKRDRRQQETTYSEELIQTAISEEEPLDVALMRKERGAILARYLSELPPNYRQVIVAYYMDGKSYQQIAEEQKVELKTVESRLYRARGWMKKHWKEDDFL
ncbi:RNA polymerase sigma factor [Paenibacillus eucommiae]|uniref:RNA polymerase sigma factor (Sigma-70 family) n=1 Tax=Paenibacillus eucommiae TaxID=1355755 RepID=A0ABS4IZZ3_9BACL|nr:sigma-70 family RNA polymerase sigma factor [Paenibacillus eucommiae]MBP1992566.1 RNA polymerase sigma factor (sigma-70 family) [Paenibacillus eucommiae]